MKNPDFIILKIKFVIFHDFLIFQALEPRIYSLYYTKIPQKIVEIYGNIMEKYYVCKYGHQNVRSSRNHLKSIGKGPGTLISHFGIIKPHKTPQIQYEIKKKQNNA